MDRRRSAWWLPAALTLAAAVGRVVAEGHADGIDSPRYRDAAAAILGDGSFGDQRYPPGLPALIAVADVLGLPAWTTTTAAGVCLVALVWWAAVRLGGPAAGAAAGLFCLVSDLLAESGVLLMSDTPAAALLVGALLACLHGRWVAAGALVAASAWVRLPHATFVAASSARRMALGAAIGLVPLAVFNLAVFGSPVSYRSDQVEWSVGYLGRGRYLDDTATPYGNHEFYAWVLGGRWGLLVPLLPIAAGIELWRRRRERATRFAAGIIAVNVGLYLFYFYQSARFVLPAASVITVYAAGWVGRVLGERPAPGSPSAEAEAVVPERDAEEVQALGPEHLG